MIKDERARAWYERKQQQRREGPQKPCECGCGALIPVTDARGKPARFKSGHNPGHQFAKGHPGLNKQPRKRGPDSPNWRGGERKNWKGYVVTWIPQELFEAWPTAFKGAHTHLILRSHKVWNEAHPEDVVRKGEHVHHLNHVRDDDRPENLAKLSATEHNALHWCERKAAVDKHGAAPYNCANR